MIESSEVVNVPNRDSLIIIGNSDVVLVSGKSLGWRTFLLLLLTFLIAFLLPTSGLDVALAQEPSPLPPGSTFRDGPDFPEMIVIPSGHFMMGASDHEYDNETAEFGILARWMVQRVERSALPQHYVAIKSEFALGKYDVTQGEFAIFSKNTGYIAGKNCMIRAGNRYHYSIGTSWVNPDFVQTDRDPVVCVSWQDAQAYISWLNKNLAKLSNNHRPAFYRLPTEAEWEFAARAGRSTVRWWGDEIGIDNANCRGCSSNSNLLRTSAVGMFKANPFGLYDVLGNVWQWTSDCWHPNYNGAPSDGSSWEGFSCSNLHVRRGASWDSDSWLVRSATRTDPGPGRYTNFIGFRVAKQID